jgi:hypothetical protein
VKAQRVVAQAQEIIQGKDNIGQKETTIQDQARKEFELFENRDVLAKLHELLISALPNAKNNPDQKSLYEAFAAGDVAKVMVTPRNKRKQLFVTHMAIYYSDNLASAQFGKTALTRRDQAQGMMGEEGSMYDQEMMAELESIYGAEYMKQMMGSQGQQAVKETGFVVTVVGYSPYERYENLLDPMNVENDRSKWGFVTRIEHLDKFLGLDPNTAPFELYSRQADHFKMEKWLVDPSIEMPAGVGEVQYVEDPANPQAKTQGVMMGYGGMRTGKPILIDPMTRENIGAETILDQYGHPKLDPTGRPMLKERDHWFTLQFKLLWKTGDAAGSSGAGQASTTGGM